MKGIIRRTNLREIATNKKSNRMKGKRKNKNNMCSCLEKKSNWKMWHTQFTGNVIDRGTSDYTRSYILFRKGIQDLNLNLSPNTVLYYTILRLALATYLEARMANFHYSASPSGKIALSQTDIILFHSSHSFNTHFLENLLYAEAALVN